MRVRWKYRRSPTILRLELLLWAGGAVSLGVYGYYWLERSMVQSHYLREIEQPVVFNPRQPAERHPFVGKIDIPRLRMSAVVLEGVDDKTLRNAVGHVPGTAVPGRNGRVTLAAHRDTFFRELQHVRLSDRIRLTAAGVKYDYEVSAIQIVSPDQVEVISATNEPRLTLVTCYPFAYIGRAPQRFIVHADPIPATGVEPLSPTPAKPVAAKPVAAKPVARRVARRPTAVPADKPAMAVIQEPAEVPEEVQPPAIEEVQPPAERRKVLSVVARPFRKAFGWIR